MANRPVYVPSRKRTKKQYFHGAFTGGFSAGFYNTVGSKEGWAPREEETERPQMPEDFMDEQDHNEWGGPTSVRQEYAASTSTPKTSSLDPMLDLVKPPAQNIGHRLLRVLGWRDGSTAYVPEEEDAVLPNSSQEQSIQALLSSKQLKKIQLQQKRVALPVPKLDTCGLGYDQYHNAPEFRAHRERRRKQAQERAKAVTASSAENRNVYRLSNLLGDKEPEKEQNEEIEQDNPLLSYETEQSFVGTKTVGGFALREDDDDVYDDGPKTSTINRDEYDTVVYEHTSDVEDDTTKDETEQEFGSVLASWATSKDGASETRTNRGTTSDGRPPLSGFVLGASNMTTGQPTRYPGPDIPDGYEPKRHEFGEHEYPGTWQDESRNVQQELVMEQRRKAVQAERKNEIPHKQKERDSGPMASAAFAGLAFAMKNRFTTSAPEEARDTKPSAIELQQPTSKHPIIIDRLQEQSVSTQAASKPITIQRSVVSFSPESLLCKRFHVAAPHHAKLTTETRSLESKGEAAYFEREILSRVTSSSASASNERTRDKKHPLQEKLPEDDGGQEGFLDNRPSMKLLESIFEPDSESSESEHETKATEPTAAGLNDQITGVLTHTPAPVPPGIPYNELAPPQSPTEEDGVDPKKGQVLLEQEGEKKRKSRKQSRRILRDDDRKRRRRSSQSSSSSDRSGRRRKEKKKKKKSHKSSRRSRD